MLALLLGAQAIDINAADALYNQGRYAEAAAQYRQFLKQLPEEPALLLRLGFCQFSLGEFAPAEESFRRVLELRPGLPQAKVGLGSALVPMGRSEEAIPLLEEAVKELGGDRQARRALGQAYLEHGEFIKGEETLRQLVKEDPRDWQSWFFLGVLLVNQNYSGPALEALEKSLALKPDNPTAQIYRAGALSQLGRLEEAEAAFAELGRNPRVKQSAEYFLGYGQLLFVKGNYEAARKQIEAAVERDPKSAKIRFWKARILFHLGEVEAALEEAERCVALGPNMPGGRNLLLRIYRRMGLEQKAAEQAEWLRRHEDKVALGRGR